MSRANIPLMRKIPEGATKEDKLKMYEEYQAELIRLNPQHFHPDGTQKTVWEYIKSSIFD